MTEEMPPKFRRIRLLQQVFTPSAPVSKVQLFRGRLDQVMEVTTALNEPGRQVVLYGERGVGKTSLANLLSDLYTPVSEEPGDTRPSVRVNCTTQDNFKTIWQKVLRNAKLDLPDAWAYASPDPDEIRLLLQNLDYPLVIVLDEFDRVEDDESLSLMADTLKGLSDHVVSTKVVIVGVAVSIDQLIGEHESVQRAIAEVLMPRMDQQEVAELLAQNLGAAGMQMVPEGIGGIVRLAEGLPHYAHLLGQRAAVRAAQDDRTEVTVEDVKAAVIASSGTHTLVKEYQTAIQSPRRDNLFSRVLVACALAEKNRLGQFTAGAVRAPMSKIMGSPYEIPAFARHLGSFTEAGRGSVLVREGQERRYTYRFRNPLLQPFAVMAALSEGSLDDRYVASIFRPLDEVPFPGL